MYECHVGGQPCEVVAQFAHALPADRAAESISAVKDWLPCGMCRLAERHAAGLPGLRLGKHERRVLLSAPDHTSGVPGRYGFRDRRDVVIEPEGDSRAASEALRRAIRKLASAGLVRMAYRRIEGKTISKQRQWFVDKGQWYTWYPDRRTNVYKRSLQLTPLGSAVVQVTRTDLESGRPIRWARYQDAALEATRRDATALVEEFAPEAREAIGYHAHEVAIRALMGMGRDGKTANRKKRYAEAKERVAAAKPVVKAIEAA